MSDVFVNPLKEFGDRIIKVSEDFIGYLIDKLKEFNIPLNGKVVELGKKESWIDWAQYSPNYSFHTDSHDDEHAIREFLKSSILKNHPCVVMEFGYQHPVCEIPIDIFFAYWFELLIIAGYESVVMTKDGRLVLEFVRRDHTLKSNFFIR